MELERSVHALISINWRMPRVLLTLQRESELDDDLAAPSWVGGHDNLSSSEIELNNSAIKRRFPTSLRNSTNDLISRRS